MNRLTENFTLEELTQSDYAVRHSINNEPSPAIVQNLRMLATGLEKIRNILGVPINVNSGYRGTELNRKLGGASNSAHLTGLAADFTARRFGSPLTIVKKLKDSGLLYDQLIYEGTWVHVSFDKKMRQQTLTATFKNGKANYSQFI
jgi:hypothetical protein